jgi:N-acetylglucosaminyldiphosphoundecaprenol N-acetyl-beta-D-mannosaminyltransferase
MNNRKANRVEPAYFKFKGIKIDNVRLENIMKIIENNVNQKGYICVNDVQNVIFASKDMVFCNAINESLLSIADGTPLAWYGKLLGCKRVRRVAGFELLESILESDNGFKHYLLGDTEETINRVIVKARKSNRNIRIAGHSPPFRKQFSEHENDMIFEKINSEDPDIIWVCFGGGKQEQWMHQNFNRLRRGVLVGVGAAFRFYIGDIYIPPKLFQKLGMQWIFRIISTRGTFFSYLRALPSFCFYFPIEVIKGRRDREIKDTVLFK